MDEKIEKKETSLLDDYAKKQDVIIGVDKSSPEPDVSVEVTVNSDSVPVTVDTIEEVAADKSPVIVKTTEDTFTPKEEVKKPELKISVEEPKKIEEEIKDVQAKVQPDQVSQYITEILGSPTEVSEILDSANDKMDEEEIKDVLNQPDHYLTRLISHGSTRVSNHLLRELNTTLQEFKKMGIQLKHNTGAIADNTAKCKTYDKASGQSNLKGKNASQAMVARLRGVKRVRLFNSGFWVKMRPLELAELSEFYNSIDLDADEIGHMLGGHMCLFDDLFIKEKFMELLPIMIDDSNLKGWNKSDNLLKAISYHDYGTLLWASCVLQYRKGIKMGLLCTNDDCKYQENDFPLDLNTLRLNNFENFPQEAIDFIVAGKPVTMNELSHYRNNILKNNKKVSIDVSECRIEYSLNVPTMYDWLSEGGSQISNLMTVVDGEFTKTNEHARNHYIIHVHQMYKAWITKSELFNPEGGSDFSTEDRTAILDSLDISQQESSDIGDKIAKYIRETKISYFCYSGLECPECGHVPSDKVDDYMAVDVQSLFFFLACQRLRIAGQN